MLSAMLHYLHLDRLDINRIIRFGKRRIVLLDPKAIQHFYANSTYTFVRTSSSRRLLKRVVT